MPPSNPYFLNPSAGFTPSQPTPTAARPDIDTGQTGWGPPGVPSRPNPVYMNPKPFTVGQPNQPQQNPNPGSAIRPTDQSNNPQAAWLQNIATFAGGNLAGSNAFGNQPTGPVRRLVDVLGQQPFGQDNPMTLLMQALQQGNYGVQMPNQATPPVQSPPIYRPPYNPGWGGPGLPAGFNPRQIMPQ